MWLKEVRFCFSFIRFMVYKTPSSLLWCSTRTNSWSILYFLINYPSLNLNNQFPNTIPNITQLCRSHHIAAFRSLLVTRDLPELTEMIYCYSSSTSLIVVCLVFCDLFLHYWGGLTLNFWNFLIFCNKEYEGFCGRRKNNIKETDDVGFSKSKKKKEICICSSAREVEEFINNLAELSI